MSGGAAGAAGEDGGAGEGGARGCETRDTEHAERVNGDVDTDRTWSGVIYVDGDISVRDSAHLTVVAGTDVIFSRGSRLRVAPDGSAAVLQVLGSEGTPVHFCGAEARAGYWDDIVVEAGAGSETALRNLRVMDAGRTDAALVLDSAVHVENLVVDGSASDGVWAADFAAGSSGLDVKGAADVALVLTNSRAATHLPDPVVSESNGDDSIHLRFSEMDPLSTFHDRGLLYVQESDVAAPAGELSIEAGVDYRFAAGASLSLGAAVDQQISVFVEGTAERPVTFEGMTPGIGSWGRIEVMDGVKSGSKLEHMEVRGAGDTSYALYVRSAIGVNHVLLDGNGGGMFVAAQGLAPGSAMLTIRNSAGSPLTLRPDALLTLPSGSFTGNELDEVTLEGGDFSGSGTVPNPGVPFYVLGAVRTLEGSSMTLLPGTQFIMTGNASFEFGANGSATVVAAGTDGARIRFTGFIERAGYWPGITTGAGVGAGSRFDFVEVGHAAAGCLNLKNAVAVTHSTFFDCEGYGIRKNPDDASDYLTTNTFENVGKGQIGNLPP